MPINPAHPRFECKQCGKTFPRRRARQEFCSGTCRSSFFIHQRNEAFALNAARIVVLERENAALRERVNELEKLCDSSRLN